MKHVQATFTDVCTKDSRCHTENEKYLWFYYRLKWGRSRLKWGRSTHEKIFNQTDPLWHVRVCRGPILGSVDPWQMLTWQRGCLLNRARHSCTNLWLSMTRLVSINIVPHDWWFIYIALFVTYIMICIICFNGAKGG